MQTILMAISAVLLLTLAGYAHYRLPFHTAGRMNIRLARVVLIVVGLGFGYVMANVYTDTRGPLAVLVFLSGFGLVHVPAAIILFIKRSRGAEKS